MKQPNLKVRVKQLIEVDGLKFKDLNGNQHLDPYEDWRLTPEERARDLVSRMTLDEKVGMMLINTRPMGLSQKDKSKTSHDGVLDEAIIEKGSTIFAMNKVYGSTYTIEDLHLRHFILRDNWSPAQIADWVNTLNEVCESTRLGIPCLIASNSRNENTEFVFGMNDAGGIFSTWPGTLGLAAAAKGDTKNGGDAGLISEFAATARQEWSATGIRKGYMYMCDVVTDPRWQRIYGTFGEDPAFVAEAVGRLIDGFQGKTLGTDSIAMTTKHFPGGGARDNGFDPHYKEGKWNCYPTPGSLEKYHLPPFWAAAAHMSSSIMPYYSAPSIDKSSVQSFMGEEIPFEEAGIAFNHYFLQHMLRNKMGFEGYINSDSGIVNNMCWGVEDKNIAARFAKAINAGVDLVADSNDVVNLKAAVENGWVSLARINTANVRLLTEMFTLGLFDGATYVDPANAAKVVSDPGRWDKAYVAHQKSVTVLKNHAGMLPLTPANMQGKQVYVEVWHKDPARAGAYTEKARRECAEVGAFTLTDDFRSADVALLFLAPKSGDYFSATPGLLELAICEDKDEVAIDGSSYTETTLTGIAHLHEVVQAVHDRDGKVVISINFILPWLLDSVEPLADALVAGYDTFYKAHFDVFSGNAKPVGVLPITLPASAEVIAVDANGQCISRNDVPGFDKDQYLPAGLHYAYCDADGNEYKLDFGLTW